METENVAAQAASPTLSWAGLMSVPAGTSRWDPQIWGQGGDGDRGCGGGDLM